MERLSMNSNEYKLYLGKWTSKIGNVIFDYVNTISIVKWSSTGSILLALYQSTEVIVSIIFNLIGGVVADGNNKKKLLIITDVLSGMVALLLSFFVNSRYVVYLMILTNVLLSIISAYNSPIYKSVIREMIEKEKIGKYNAVSNAGMQIISVISPLFALILVLRFSSQVALLFNAFTFFLSAVLEILLKPLAETTSYKMDKNFMKNLVDGVKYIVSQREIFLMILLSSATNFFLAGYNLGVPNTCILLKEVSKHIYTIILVCEALGGVTGSYLSIRLNSKIEKKKLHYVLYVVSLALCSIPAFCESKNIVLCVIPFFVANASMSMFNIGFMTSMQTQVDTNYSGRIFSVIFAFSALMMPAGSMLFSFVLKRIGILTFLVVGGGMLIVNITYIFLRKA